MPYFEFIWTPDIIEHLAENAVTPDEFEEAVCFPIDVQRSNSSGRPAAFGFANDGRAIICVYELLDDVRVLPVTAFYVEETE